MVIDEVHVIEDWKNEFRKDYGKLETPAVIIHSGPYSEPC